MYNTSDATINLNGLISGGNGDSGSTILSNVYVPPGEYALLAARSDSSQNGGMENVDYQYSYFEMNMDHQFDNVTIGNGIVEIDSVTYNTNTIGGDYPANAGQSLNLSEEQMTTSGNDSASVWYLLLMEKNGLVFLIRRRDRTCRLLRLHLSYKR